jgi:hypothetical protein
VVTRVVAMKCLEVHLVDKARNEAVSQEVVWFEIARSNLSSAMSLVQTDLNGSMILLWSSLQKVAKGMVSRCGCRVEGETHGKIADFLRCCFAGHLEPRQLDRLHLLREGRNVTSYGRPDSPNPKLISEGFAMADRMLTLVGF